MDRSDFEILHVVRAGLEPVDFVGVFESLER
jgi:hypothetical protein